MRAPPPRPPPYAGPGAHLGQNKGPMHPRRRRGLGRAAGAYLGLRGFLRDSVCRAGRDQDGPIGECGQADESRRRRRPAGTASRSGQARAAAAAGGRRGQPLAGTPDELGPGPGSRRRASG